MSMLKTGITKNAVLGKLNKKQLNKVAKKSDKLVDELLDSLNEEENEDGNDKKRKPRNSNT